MSFRLRSASRAARGLLAYVAVACVAVACHGDRSVGPAQSIAGSWDGTAAYGTVRFSATFTQSGDSVGGSGDFSSPLASGPFLVAGSLSGSDVNLVLTSTQLGATTYAGHFTNSGTITGHLQAPAYSDLELTLQRHVSGSANDTP